MNPKPMKGNPASAKPMPGMSERAQKLLGPVRRSITVGPKYQGIPAAMRTTKGTP
jgi:hypothetical protein